MDGVGPERLSVQRIKRALKKIGSKNGVRLALLCGYCLAFGIPFLHVYMATPPTQDEMRIVEGRAHFQYRVKRGYMLMVDGKDYTCAGQYLNADPDCFNVSESPAKRTLLEGKTVEILWFHQSAPIFGLARRVADIRYDGVSQLPPHFLEKGLQYEKDSAGTDALITFSGCCSCCCSMSGWTGYGSETNADLVGVKGSSVHALVRGGLIEHWTGAEWQAACSDLLQKVLASR